jgi:hypothetical protein
MASFEWQKTAVIKLFVFFFLEGEISPSLKECPSVSSTHVLYPLVLHLSLVLSRLYNPLISHEIPGTN